MDKSVFRIKVEVIKGDKLKRVKGTRLFVTTPASYQPIERLIRLQRDNNTYFQAIEVPNSPFNEYKSKLTKEAIEKQGARVDIIKPIRYNGYEGLYFAGPSKTPGETKLGLAFGDDSFVMMLVGVCQTADKKAIEELNEIFSTSYYDKNFDFPPLELVDFKFDESITGFMFATTMGNMFIYSPNGKNDLQNAQKDPVAFQLSSIDAPSFAKSKELLENIVSRYSSQGVQLTNVKKEETMINGNPAYEILLEAVDVSQRDKAILYQVIIHKENKAVLFLGTDSAEGKWIDKYKATVQSIKM